jgi:diguanylate cyclase (GGDEF)-like protein/PAS domain S-box-containing protein
MLDDPGEVEGAPPPSVLVVNDRANQRLAIRSTLASLDVAVVEADSGRAALRAVFKQTFAVILMDVQMPDMDGYETADLIRRRLQSSTTPIIFITAYASDDIDTVAAYTRGAVDFLFTPLVPEVLRAKVSVFVDLFVQSQKLQFSLDSIMTLNAALRDSQARTQTVLDNVADGIVTAGESGLIESFNTSAQALFGYSEEEAIGKPFTLMLAPERQAELRGSWTKAPGPPGDARVPSRATETIGRRRDGSTFAMEIEHSDVILDDRIVPLAFVRDISERKAYTESLEHQALHDGLTGLANRTLFGEQVLRALASAKRTNQSQAILVVDLDGFKHVNDSLGHDHGDALLKQVGERLAGAMRENDTIARLGGDEFGILLAGVTDMGAAVAVAWKIQKVCKPGFAIHAEVVNVSASVGIAMFPEHGKTTAELLQRADAAMYVAKKAGTGYAVFDTARETATARRLALLADLRQCIVRNELVLHFQPKLDLTTGELTGVEALIRWQHPIHGLLLPANFMTEVESTELIEPVTRWVLNGALRQQQIWRAEGIDLTMAVNISAHSLRPSGNLPEIVAELTDTWHTAPRTLTLELTEGALIEAHAPAVLSRLHQMGQLLAIDDFGTGYSSLAYLQRLPVDELKIDRSFIMHLATDRNDDVIVRSIIDLAHNLGLTVVAEGVEDQATMDLLVEYECDIIQGYHLARPCPIEDLNQWLTTSSHQTHATQNGSQAVAGPRDMQRWV